MSEGPPAGGQAPAAREPSGPVLGVDLGSKRVGLALGDPGSGLILPLPTLDHPGDEAGLVQRLAETARARDVVEVLVGLPLHASGAKSSNSREAERIRALLAEALPGVQVGLQDERWTSAAAESELGALGLRWWQVPKSQVDAMSAMQIVRDAFSQRGLLRPSEPPEATPPTPEPPRGERQGRRSQLRKRGRRERREEQDD